MSRAPECEVRCACQDCGAHTVGHIGPNGVAGWCPNCGSYEVTPVRITAPKLEVQVALPSQDCLRPPPFGEETSHQVPLRISLPGADTDR